MTSNTTGSFCDQPQLLTGIVDRGEFTVRGKRNTVVSQCNMRMIFRTLVVAKDGSDTR
jgi:hypothetical protein